MDAFSPTKLIFLRSIFPACEKFTDQELTSLLEVPLSRWPEEPEVLRLYLDHGIDPTDWPNPDFPALLAQYNIPPEVWVPELAKGHCDL